VSEPPGDHAHMIRRIREAVDRFVPADATVSVVSHGDDALLDLSGRRAWHFPQTPGGTYSGSHPADGAEAVAHLEINRARGRAILTGSRRLVLVARPLHRTARSPRRAREVGRGRRVVPHLRTAGDRGAADRLG
jgi:hypothetical protein